MSENQSYGVLRVVGVKHAYRLKKGQRASIKAGAAGQQEVYSTGQMAEERLIHLLVRRETSIGRALDNDVILLDPTVSREHARLAIDEQEGWMISNLSAQNMVSINGRPVASGEQRELQPQDYIQIGNTLLQLIAPAPGMAHEATAVTLETVISLQNFFPTPLQELNGRHKKNTSAETIEKEKALLAVQETPVPNKANISAGAQTWHGIAEEAGEMEEEQLWERNSTSLRAALSQRLGVSTRRVLLIAGLVLIVMSIVGTIALNNSGSFSVLAQQGPMSIIGTLTIPLIPALGIMFLVSFVDRFEREPWFLRLAAFLWGAIIAVPSAAFIEQYFDILLNSRWPGDPNIGLHAFLQGLNAGVTEETVKGLGLLLLFFVLRDEFDNVTDGIVYGALIGAGFAMVENIFYFTDNQADWPVLIVGRIVLGWFCHSTFTVCFGAALGYIRHTRIKWQHLVIPLAGYLLAVGLHTVFDFLNVLVRDLIPVLFTANSTTALTVSLITVVADYIPPFIAQIVILYVLMKALAHEAAVIREFLGPEVCSGIITVNEYALMQNSVARVREERRVLRQRGVKQWWRVKELYQTEIGLAFRKWHVSMGDEPKLGYVQSEEAYRTRIKRLRQEIQGGEEKWLKQHMN